MIVPVPTLITDCIPITHSAMLNRLRIRNALLRQRRLKITCHFTKVRKILFDTELFRLYSPAEHDVHSLRHDPLYRTDQLRVEAQLNQRPRFRRSRKLRLHNFIRPISKLTRSLDPYQKVRPSIPQRTLSARRRLHTGTAGVSPATSAFRREFFPTKKRRLIDHLRTAPHRQKGLPRRLPPTQPVRHRNDLEPLLIRE